MLVRSSFLLLLVFVTGAVSAQVVPAEGALLNHTQIMFEYPEITGAAQYLIQIAEDTTGSTFSRPFIEQKDSSTATLISGLGFGKKYKWQYRAYKKDTKPEWKGPYRFQILTDSILLTDKLRLHVLQNDSARTAGGLIFVDCFHAAFDRSGNIVWFLPTKVNLYKMGIGSRVMQLTPQGTLTFIFQGNGSPAAEEFKLNGQSIWGAPDNGKVSGDSIEYYHHDFKKLKNGNYMVLSKLFAWKKVPAKYQDVYDRMTEQKEVRDSVMYARMEFGTIIEYAPDSSVVWSWNSADYITDEDLFAIRANPRPNGNTQFMVNRGSKGQPSLPNNPYGGMGANSNSGIEAHLNGFSADTTGQFVYASFKHLSRIVKIEKKTGKVVEAWGAMFPSGEAKQGNGFFSDQHDANILADGTIGVFNNSDRTAPEVYSSAVIFKPATPYDTCKIVWEMECNFDSTDINKSFRGGNVDELPNHNLLVCTGNNNRIFEATRNKKLVWNAVVETKKNGINYTRGTAFPLFQAHYASSLYPCYYTAQVVEKSMNKQTGSFTIKLFNEGTEPDSYTVYITSSSQNFNQQLSIAPIQKDKSAIVPVNPLSQPLAGEKIQVLIKSNTNPAFERKLTLEYR